MKIGTSSNNGIQPTAYRPRLTPRVQQTGEAPLAQARPKIPIAVQVRVLYRDGWLCRWCHRPTIFPLAMKYLDEFVRQRTFELPIAYYDPRYRRDAAPLLDHLACVLDHVEAHSKGGASTEDNLAVACNKRASINNIYK